MCYYTTSQIAKQLDIHVNTVRFYEEVGLLSKIPRKENGYRIYSKVHLEQLILVKIGLKTELLQNGLRKRMIEILKFSAEGKYDCAMEMLEIQIKAILKEKMNAEESIEIIEENIKNAEITKNQTFTRQQVANALELTMDTLRNWEMNGILAIKRKENGYRVYDENDIKKIKITRTLRCANFSLIAILRLFNDLEKNVKVNINHTINTPKEQEEIISVCDQLLTSLNKSHQECLKMFEQLNKLKKLNPPV